MVQYTLELPASSAPLIESAIQNKDMENLKTYALAVAALGNRVSLPEWLHNPEARITQIKNVTTVTHQGKILNTRVTIIIMKD